MGLRHGLCIVAVALGCRAHDTSSVDSIPTDPNHRGGFDQYWPSGSFFGLPGVSDPFFEDSSFFGMGNPFPTVGGNDNPRLEMETREDTVVITARIPGADNSTINVKVEDNVLTVEADMSIKKTVQDSAGNIISSSSSMQRFSSTQPLPVRVNPDIKDMKYEDEILTIKLAREDK